VPPTKGELEFLFRYIVNKSTSQAADIKSHSFFKGMKWDQLLELAIPPPFVPDMDGPHSLKYVRPKYLEQVRYPLTLIRQRGRNSVFQPAVETPVHDSPLAQRVREEGANLFQGFSFERPSLLQRRKSRPRQQPVEDCFQDLGFSTETNLALKASGAIDSALVDCGAAEGSDLSCDGIATHASTAEVVQMPLHWFDIPPPDACVEPYPTSPSENYDIEDEILGGGRSKHGFFAGGSRPKVHDSLISC
jgi:hypothetical protein